MLSLNYLKLSTSAHFYREKTDFLILNLKKGYNAYDVAIIVLYENPYTFTAIITS